MPLPVAARLEAADLVGHRAAAVRDDDFQRREILEHVGIDQAEDGDGLLVDEVQRVGRALRLRAGARGCGPARRARKAFRTADTSSGRPAPGLSWPLFSKGSGLSRQPRKPIFTQRSSSGSATSIGCARDLRQARRCRRKRSGISFTVRAMMLLVSSVNQWTSFARLGVVHHLERPRRDELHVGAGAVDHVQVPAAAPFRPCWRR